ncbi:STAS domain-containing protein [Tomitella fengzijianii]|uniref:STAS domain-containing protein n=1 Tax=Tomitella fengzijianii TaxID=2597660 RepID=UPI001E4825D2|nr:STAS domain-containing protein [Tomitella fengzijianii]
MVPNLQTSPLIDACTTEPGDAQHTLNIACRRCTNAPAPRHIVSAAGDIDARSHDDFVAALDAIRSARPSGIVLDLTGVDFIGSEGLAALAEFAATAESAGARWALCAHTPVARLLHVLDLDGAIVVHGTIEEAAAAIGAPAATTAPPADPFRACADHGFS